MLRFGARILGQAGQSAALSLAASDSTSFPCAPWFAREAEGLDLQGAVEFCPRQVDAAGCPWCLLLMLC